MFIRPKWLKDICSVLFSVYYIVYATEADEKVCAFGCTYHAFLNDFFSSVDFARYLQSKCYEPHGKRRPIHMSVMFFWPHSNRSMLNPCSEQIRAFSYFPKISIRRKLMLPRPSDSTYQRPITAWLFFAPPEHQLCRATEMILDFPGGGFISMTPEHHEDRLRMWAVRTGKPVLSIEYGKAPECQSYISQWFCVSHFMITFTDPYPFAIDECFDAYRVLVESAGKLIGMSGTALDVVFSGDSA